MCGCWVGVFLLVAFWGWGVVVGGGMVAYASHTHHVHIYTRNENTCASHSIG